MDATEQTCWACDAGKVPIDPTKQTRWAYDAWRACSRRGKVLSATSSSSKLQTSKSNLNLPEGESILKPKAHSSTFKIEARSSKLQASCSKLCEGDELSLPRANGSLDGSFVRETKEQTCLKLKRQVPSSSILREKIYVAAQVPSSSFLAGQVPSSRFPRETYSSLLEFLYIKARLHIKPTQASKYTSKRA